MPSTKSAAMWRPVMLPPVVFSRSAFSSSVKAATFWSLVRSSATTWLTLVGSFRQSTARLSPTAAVKSLSEETKNTVAVVPLPRGSGISPSGTFWASSISFLRRMVGSTTSCSNSASSLVCSVSNAPSSTPLTSSPSGGASAALSLLKSRPCAVLGRSSATASATRSPSRPWPSNTPQKARSGPAKNLGRQTKRSWSFLPLCTTQDAVIRGATG
mmetsp:Transcript_12709/g.32471  ORF Transcript_12709/g.32471 Transcript_12709/m.32471 type:complete len:214 (-) Transcript_12709:213-854(-)